MNAFIYRENEPADFAYIVKSGTFRVTKKLQKLNTATELSASEAYRDPSKAIQGAN